MANEEQTQQMVRQRAGFLCENPDCRKATIGEYAHVIPDAWGGPYTEDNLLFLCGDCHRKLDHSVLRRKLPQALDYLRAIAKAGNKRRDIVSDSFEFFSNRVEVRIGAGIRIINCGCVLCAEDRTCIFSAQLKDSKLYIGGALFDQHNQVLLEFNDNRFKAHGDMLWDLVMERNGELEIISSDRKIFIHFSQEQDSALRLSGRFFVNGNLFEATEQGLLLNGRIYMRECVSERCGCGIGLRSPRH